MHEASAKEIVFRLVQDNEEEDRHGDGPKNVGVDAEAKVFVAPLVAPHHHHHQHVQAGQHHDGEQQRAHREPYYPFRPVLKSPSLSYPSQA